MAKKDIVKWTPETKAQAENRLHTISAEITSALDIASRGYLTVAPLIAEMYDKDLYVLAGYKNIDDYAKAEHAMSHGTVSGLRKVFALYGEKDDNDTNYRIPDDCAKFGYTKLLLFANSQKDFERANINPLEHFTPDMTIKQMTQSLASLLEDKATEQDETAIDTTATDTTDTTDTTATDTTATDDTKDAGERADFTACYNAVMREFSAMKASYGKMPKGVGKLFMNAENALNEIAKATGIQ